MRKETSTNFENSNLLNAYCNASKTMQLISGRWKIPVLFFLFKHQRGQFSEFRKLLPAASDRMLALHLTQLINDDLIQKKETAKKIHYELSDKGKSLQPILDILAAYQL